MNTDLDALLARIRNRPNDAPMPTERLLDDAADAIESLQAECARLRTELAAAQKEMAAPGGKLQPQLLEAIHDCKRLDRLLQSVTAERTEAWRLVGESESEIRRLREELAAAQKDAERYRWMRDSGRDIWIDPDMNWSSKKMDELIDVAMAQEERDDQ